MTLTHTVTVRDRTEPLPVGKILAVGGNYKHHVTEMGGDPGACPMLFLKPPSALVADGGVVRRPSFSIQLHHELELVVAIGKTGTRIDPADAAGHILGYGVGLDMTLRDVQTEAKRRGHPWSVAKGFDTAAPVSEIIPVELIPDPSVLVITLRVNGELRQEGRLTDLTLSIPETIAYVSQVFTLEPGDLLFTGTPEGVGPAYPGDVLEASLDGWTRMRVTVDDGADRGRDILASP